MKDVRMNLTFFDLSNERKKIAICEVGKTMSLEFRGRTGVQL